MLTLNESINYTNITHYIRVKEDLGVAQMEQLLTATFNPQLDIYNVFNTIL